MNVTWEEAVTYAREQLETAFREIKKIESIMSRHEMDILGTLARLNELCASDTSWLAEARALSDLNTEERARAAKNGFSLSDSPSDGDGPYISRLKDVLSDATRDPAAFDAVRLHAAKLMSSDIPLCYELKSFACDVFRDEVARPADKKPKLHEARNAIFHALIFDLAERFDVKPTRNRVSFDRKSACDILAEAMPNKAGLPKGYASLERIWFQGERAWERECSGEELDLS